MVTEGQLFNKRSSMTMFNVMANWLEVSARIIADIAGQTVDSVDGVPIQRETIHTMAATALEKKFGENRKGDSTIVVGK